MKYKTKLKLQLLACATISLLLFSCGKEKVQPEHSGILVKNMDTLVKPGDNFDAYVNGSWVKNNQIPADKSSYGVSEIIDDEAIRNVQAIIVEATKGHFADGSKEQKMGDFYESCLDQKTRDAKGMAPLTPEMKAIDAISSYDDIAAYFGKGMQKVLTPFVLFVEPDYKDPSKYALFAWQNGLGLPEREYYLLPDATSVEIRSKYITHITNMLKLGGVANPEAGAQKIMALETAMAAKQMKKEDAREDAKTYNKYKISDVAKLMPSFNLDKLLKNAGVKNTDEMIIAQVDYLKALDNIIKTTPVDTWKIYFKWGLLHSKSGLLTTATDDEDFSFYSKILYGVTEKEPEWRRAVGLVNQNLGEIIGESYVKKHFSPEAKERISGMVKNVLKAYEESIKKLNWMTPETKKQALEKISKFYPKVGYPDKWRDYSALKIVKGDLYGNAQRAEAFEYNRQINKLGQPVDRAEWSMTPQTVNAYYNQSLNEIVFPAAILQPPFFDPDADDAVNYGSIGAVIGHEIGHGFDDQGAGFDGDGVMRNWWTKSDLLAFQKRTAALADQFSQYKVFPDLKINGKYTLGENIGDLGGLAIALSAYKMSLNGKPSPKIDGFTGEQRFFIGYGMSWLSKQRAASLRAQIANDPHAPAKFRVNGIVRNIPEFYEAFDVKPGDSLYLAPERRVKIW